MTGQQIAVVLSLFSAVAYAAAAVVQERAAAAPRLGRRVWLGVACMGTGAGLHALALQYGTVGVVQALGTLTLLAALPMGAAITGRPVDPRAWRDAGLTAAGLAILTTLTTAPEVPTMLSAGQTRLVGLLTAAVVIGLLACAAHAAHRPRPRSLFLSVAAGAAFGVASVFAKSEMARMSHDGISIASGRTLGAIVVFALTGLALSQASYRGAGLAAPLAAATVANPAAAATVGNLLLGEGFRFGMAGTVLALCAALASGFGVVGLILHSSRPAGRPHREAKAGASRPADRVQARCGLPPRSAVRRTRGTGRGDLPASAFSGSRSQG